MDDSAEELPPANSRTGANGETLQLLATGLNAHDQLSASRDGQDIYSFTPITAPSLHGTTRILHASWSTTALQTGDQIVGLGNQNFTTTPSGVGAAELFDAFGDHNGLLGCLDTAGRLWLLKEAEGRLECQADSDGSPLIGHIALAGNGKVAITFKQAPGGRLCHVLSFDSLEELLAWYRDPAETGYNAEKQHFMLPGQPRQLLAGTGTFLLRMEGGELWSWGDARYSSLGRSIGEVPAERPAMVEAVGGLKIQKVACGGWLTAALSADGACYIWGTGTPGTDARIKCMKEHSVGEVVLVDLRDGGVPEPLDVLDVAVGGNHVVLLAEGNRCFAAGENKNGQLGVGHDQAFVEDWARIALGAYQVKGIACGPMSTYAWTTGGS